MPRGDPPPGPQLDRTSPLERHDLGVLPKRARLGAPGNVSNVAVGLAYMHGAQCGEWLVLADRRLQRNLETDTFLVQGIKS